MNDQENKCIQVPKYTLETLLQYELGILSPLAQTAVEEHFAGCDWCVDTARIINEVIELLGKEE